MSNPNQAAALGLDLDNLFALLEIRDLDATAPGESTFTGTGRGLLTTNEVRAALLGHVRYEGPAA